VRGMSSKATPLPVTTPSLKFKKRYRYACSIFPTLSSPAPKEKPLWRAPMPPWPVAREQFLAKVRRRPRNKRRMEYDRRLQRLLQAEVCFPASPYTNTDVVCIQVKVDLVRVHLEQPKVVQPKHTDVNK
jgi:hypothetical protein